MAGSVTHIWRHPIKAVGCEALKNVTLQKGCTVPWDRVWAVVHEASKFDVDAPEWMSKSAFNQGAKTPALMAIKSTFDEETGQITLRHLDLKTLVVNPDTGAEKLVAWVAQLVPETRAQPVGIAKVSGCSLTDQKHPYVSIIGTESLAALEAAAGGTLEQERFRANFWVNGIAPWQEFDWIGKDIQIGNATLRVEERIGRCVATTASPLSGKIDIDTLTVLESNFGHKDLGVFARVIKGGSIAINDTLKVL